MEILRKAKAAGQNAAAYEARGFCYAVDFQSMVQLNTNTGRIRKIREVSCGGGNTGSRPGAAEGIAYAASASASPAGSRTAAVEHADKRRRVEAAGADLGRAPVPRSSSPPVADKVLESASGESAAPARAVAATAPARASSVVAPSMVPEPAATAAPARPAAGGAAAGLARIKIAPEAGNSKLAEIFEEMGAIMKLKRDRFRARAYEKAAAALRAHPEPILNGAQAKKIEGVGVGMARRIDIVLETGELEELHELKRDSDVVALRELRSVHGIGPKIAAGLVEKGIRSLNDLRREVGAGKVHLDAVQTIGLKHADEFCKKIPRAEMVEHEAFLKHLRDEEHPKLIMMICGSYRRGKAECGDIDVLITTKEYTAARPQENSGGCLLRGFVQGLRNLSYITDDLAAGNTKYMGVCKLVGPDRMHRRIDIRCIRYDQFHFGTLYFTGSAALSVRLRMKAIELGMKLSEYSLESTETKETVHADSERDIFKALGVDYLEPHQR